MNDDRPLWLLDVDGVLNVNPGKPGWHAPPRRTVVHVGGDSYLLRWAPALIVRIRALHATGRVEIRWATSWIGNTDLLARTLGLPDFEDAYPDPGPPVYAGHDEHRPLKLGAAVFALAEGRRLIWTDDEAIPPGWLARDDMGDEALLLAPRPNRGLRPEDMDRIEAYVGAEVPVP